MSTCIFILHLPVNTFPGEVDHVGLDASMRLDRRAPTESDEAAGDQDRDHITRGRRKDTGAW